jgi:hypothetical protein
MAAAGHSKLDQREDDPPYKTPGFNVMKKNTTIDATSGEFDVADADPWNATVCWPILEHVLGSK